MPGQRKSIVPMAERLGVDSQSLQQFVTDSPWKEEELWRAIRQEIVPHLEPLEAWVVDETGWVKQGSHSVGVSHQYCGAVGKPANCQVSVEVVVSDGWIAAPVAGRLYLPENRTQDRERCQAAGQIAIAVDNALAYEEILKLKDKLAQEKVYLEDEIRSEMHFEQIVGIEPGAQARPATGRDRSTQRFHSLTVGRNRNRKGIDCARHPRPQPAQGAYLC